MDWSSLLNKAEEEHSLHNYSKSEDCIKAALKSAEESGGGEHLDVAIVLLHYGDFLEHQERYIEGEAAYARAVQIAEKLGRNDLFLAMVLRNLAQCVCAQGRHAEAVELRARARVICLEYRQRL